MVQPMVHRGQRVCHVNPSHREKSILRLGCNCGNGVLFIVTAMIKAKPRGERGSFQCAPNFSPSNHTKADININDEF